MFIDLNILKFILWVKRFSFFWNNFHLAFFNHYGKLYQTKLLQIFSFSHVSFPNNIGVFSNISIPRFLVIVSLCWNYEKDLKVLGFKSLEINQRHTNLVFVCARLLQRNICFVLLWKCNNRKWNVFEHRNLLTESMDFFHPKL